jgi:purine-binding chemotaxis protein CheW
VDQTPSVGLLQFSIEGERHAIALGSVERVIRAVALSPLPGSPAVIRGIFSLHGRIVPVADPRRRLGLADREIALEDRIIIARTPARLLGLLVHGDLEVLACDRTAIVAAESVLSGAELVEGVGRLPDGLVLIQSLAKFFSLEEERRLAEAVHAFA